MVSWREKKKKSDPPKTMKYILGLFLQLLDRTYIQHHWGLLFIFRHIFLTKKIFTNEKTLWQKFKNKKSEIAFVFIIILSFLGYIVFSFFSWGPLFSPLKWKTYNFIVLTVSHYRPNSGRKIKSEESCHIIGISWPFLEKLSYIGCNWDLWGRNHINGIFWPFVGGHSEY